MDQPPPTSRRTPRFIAALRRPCRAVPDLDPLPDDECERLLAHIESSPT